jgi:hypothetical protein
VFPLKSSPNWAPFRRAVFEFLIIVTGVLVALTADEWRQEWGERQDLEEHLASVLEEVRANAGTVRIVRSGISSRKISALEAVIAHLESGDSTVADPEALLEEFADSTAVWRPFIVRNQFDALKNSGLLRLARDDDLVNQMSGTFEISQILFDQVNLIQGEYPIVVNQFIPASYQSSLGGMATYSRGGVAPEIALDIGAGDAVALIHDERSRLLRLARSEAAVATAVWYALTRILDDFQQLERLLSDRLGVPSMADEV